MCRALLRSPHPCKSLSYQSLRPCGFLNSSGFIRALAKILLLPHFHSGRWGGNKAHRSCHSVMSRHKGAKANQGLIKCLQRTFRVSDKEAQGNLLQSICHSWRKQAGCKSLLFITGKLSQGDHQQRRMRLPQMWQRSSVIHHCSCHPRRPSAMHMLIHTEQPPPSWCTASCESPRALPLYQTSLKTTLKTVWDLIHKPWYKMNSGWQGIKKPATELWSFGLPLFPTFTLAFRKASVHLLEGQDQFCRSTGPLIDLSSSKEVKRWLWQWQFFLWCTHILLLRTHYLKGQ